MNRTLVLNSNSSPSSTMTFARLFPIFGFNFSSEKLRKCTKGQWSFMSLSSTTFISTRFPMSYTGVIKFSVA